MTTNRKMSKPLVVLAMAGTMLTTGLTGLALANDRSDRDRERGGASGFEAGERFARADVDGDRMLSIDEFTAQGMERFTSADADGDGLVTAEEMVAAATQALEERESERAERRAERRLERVEARVERMIERMDSDEDGAISTEEAQAASENMFARLDRDEDGSLEPRELRRGFRGGDRGERFERDE